MTAFTVRKPQYSDKEKDRKRRRRTEKCQEHPSKWNLKSAKTKNLKEAGDTLKLQHSADRIIVLL